MFALLTKAVMVIYRNQENNQTGYENGKYKNQ